MVAVYGSFEDQPLLRPSTRRRDERVLISVLALLLISACVAAVAVVGKPRGAVEFEGMMDEFDPIEDADSNYGRVIGIKSVSRTNPVITEDVDASPEEKGVSVQSLYDVDGPATTDVNADSWKASAQYTNGWYKQPAVDPADVTAVQIT